MIPQSFWVSLMGWGHLGWLPTNAALTWQLTKWGTWIIFSGNLSGTQGRGRVSPLHSCDHQAQEVGAGWDSHWCGPNSLGDFRQIPLRPPQGRRRFRLCWALATALAQLLFLQTWSSRTRDAPHTLRPNPWALGLGWVVPLPGKELPTSSRYWSKEVRIL